MVKGHRSLHPGSQQIVGKTLPGDASQPETLGPRKESKADRRNYLESRAKRRQDLLHSSDRPKTQMRNKSNGHGGACGMIDIT